MTRSLRDVNLRISEMDVTINALTRTGSPANHAEAMQNLFQQRRNLKAQIEKLIRMSLGATKQIYGGRNRCKRIVLMEQGNMRK